MNIFGLLTQLLCTLRKLKIEGRLPNWSNALPLGDQQHLKRVRCTGEGMDIILHAVKGDDLTRTQTLKGVLGEAFDAQGLSAEVRVVQVPRHPPLTRAQFEQSNCLWPTQFHEDKHIARVLSGKLFSDQERATMENYMALAVTAAQESRAGIGVAVVNPSTDRVLAVAVGDGKHPLRHATMVAIDLVARQQGGGAWPVPPGCEMCSITRRDLEVGSKVPYLCTGYDFYISHEPCTMCGMALVHSRVRRVFYGQATPWGALGTCRKLHVQPGLNHHFEVWRGLLRQRTDVVT
ncbi:probable inactive tRNA-specific adenosine deaminase-like protein 3 isoform X2 [Ixodes scapularis]|uniref:probable inactive tRNA-specific adenosine deaminase-like protein 3 isoform X2 n=1 Tax=Ixodes scapularis TaxID=6945 RepID=UPI001A9CD6CF|nr:probable inactive tRNA-specific adenosine deaminase-like protein 3 isoform X2 [Ixodes scapularis]